jgi:large subunit ribosomal protein L35
MPKNKTHSGIKKRVKITGTGKLRSQQSGLRHHLETKPSKVTRRLTGTKAISAADAPRVKKLLGR